MNLVNARPWNDIGCHDFYILLTVSSFCLPVSSSTTKFFDSTVETQQMKVLGTKHSFCYIRNQFGEVNSETMYVDLYYCSTMYEVIKSE